MAQVAGRESRILIGATNASPVTKSTSFDLGAASDFLDTTAMGDTTKTFIVDLPDSSIKVEAFYDDTYFTLVDAALNQTLMKVYAYPKYASTGIYFYSTFYVSMDSFTTAIGAVVKQSFTMKPSTSLTFVHT